MEGLFVQAAEELHSQRVDGLGKDSVSGRPYRNGNVMYEVGLALACRHSSEVLLVRDDHDAFLFDVSTIPHTTINFANKSVAIDALRRGAPFAPLVAEGVTVLPVILIPLLGGNAIPSNEPEMPMVSPPFRSPSGPG